MSGIFDLPANYWDHLNLNRMLFERFHGRPDRLALLDRFLVRSIRGFIQNAHSVFVAPELEDYFAAARTLYCQLDPTDISRYAVLLGHKIALYSLLAGDFELFSSPESALAGCSERSGSLAIALNHPPVEALAPLLDIDRTQAWRLGTAMSSLERVALSANKSILDLEGSVEFDGGEALPISPIGLVFVLTVGPDLRVPMILTPLDDTPRGAHWRAQVPVADLSWGNHDLIVTSDALDQKHKVTDRRTRDTPLSWRDRRRRWSVEVTVNEPHRVGVRKTANPRRIMTRVKRTLRLLLVRG